MKRRTRLRTTAVSVALVPALLLSACGADDTEDAEATTSSPSAAPSDEVSDEPTDEAGEESADSNGSYRTPEWAKSTITTGDVLTTADLEDIKVEVHQIGTAKAPKDGMFVDPDTKESILKKGDEVVYVNYVFTNNGDPIDLGPLVVNVRSRYADWKWAQGMDSVTDSDMYRERNLSPDSVEIGYQVDPVIYTLGKGETFAWADNFAHQKGGEITFTFEYIPVDSDGEMLHDERKEKEVTTTIK